MALKKCQECGNEVSTKADKCPHCGAKVKSGIGCLGLIGIIFLIGMFGSFFGEKNKSAMIIVSAIGSRYGQKRSLSMADHRSFFCWPAWQIDVIQQILEQFLRPCSEKSLGCSSPLAVSVSIIVWAGWATLGGPTGWPKR
jgi:hypothetical protein